MLFFWNFKRVYIYMYLFFFVCGDICIFIFLNFFIEKDILRNKCYFFWFFNNVVRIFLNFVVFFKDRNLENGED